MIISNDVSFLNAFNKAQEAGASSISSLDTSNLVFVSVNLLDILVTLYAFFVGIGAACSGSLTAMNRFQYLLVFSVAIRALITYMSLLSIGLMVAGLAMLYYNHYLASILR